MNSNNDQILCIAKPLHGAEKGWRIISYMSHTIASDAALKILSASPSNEYVEYFDGERLFRYIRSGHLQDYGIE